MAIHLFPLVRSVILTRFPSPRALDPNEIAKMLPAFGEKLTVDPDPARAVRSAASEAGTRGTVVVAGSLFLVGEVKRFRPRLKP
jgi:dihydrofolate synthase/folylpolyglutamate synthase